MADRDDLHISQIRTRSAQHKSGPLFKYITSSEEQRLSTNEGAFGSSVGETETVPSACNKRLPQSNYIRTSFDVMRESFR